MVERNSENTRLVFREAGAGISLPYLRTQPPDHLLTDDDDGPARDV